MRELIYNLRYRMDGKKIFIAIAIIAVLIGGFGISRIIKASGNYKEASDEYDSLSEYVSADDISNTIGDSVSDDSSDSVADIKDPANESALSDSSKSLNIAGLMSLNPDTVGWIYFKEGKISYPLMKDDGTNKYLKKTFYGEDNAAGAIFIPKENSPYLTDMNTIIYGHNMKNGTMFGTLKYIWREGHISDPYIYIYTLSGVNVYKIFSVYRTVDSSDVYVLPSSEKSYDEYVSKALKNNHISGLDPLIPDGRPNIITLSTCYGPAGTEDRLVVQAYLYKSVKSDETKKSLSTNNSNPQLPATDIKNNNHV